MSEELYHRIVRAQQAGLPAADLNALVTDLAEATNEAAPQPMWRRRQA